MPKFEEDYFKNLNYSNYLERYERYVKTAEEIYFYFSKLGLIDKNYKILDYGCGVGFLIKAFKKIGFKKIYGFDISSWAKKYAKKLNCRIVNKTDGKYDMGIFLDVLEHMTDKEIKNVFKKTKFDKLLLRIPCSEEPNSKKFYLKISRIDKTHINCKTKNEWINLFKSFGYKSFLKLNLNTIYDSKGCLCLLVI